MSLNPLTGLAYHSQDKTTYCGAAVQQMMLRPFEPLLLQGTLAGQNSIPPGNPPNGVLVGRLVTTLNSRMGAGPFFAASPAPNALSVAVAALQRSRTGAAARIADGAHWVVFNGVVLEQDSSIPRGFYIHDPHAAAAQSNGHMDHDGCGTSMNLGMRNEYYTLAGMRKFSKIPVDLVSYTGGTVTTPLFGTLVSVEHARGSRVTSMVPFNPADMATLSIAADGIASGSGPLSSILTGFHCVAPQPPVNTSTVPYWYIALRANFHPLGCALIAPHNGELLAVMVSGKEQPLMDLSPQSVRDELQKNAKLIAEIAPQFAWALTGGLAPIQASFFWSLCREAPSPSQPLVQFRIGKYALYKAYDGTFHANLTPLDR